jgi:hypothetical protein
MQDIDPGYKKGLFFGRQGGGMGLHLAIERDLLYYLNKT